MSVICMDTLPTPMSGLGKLQTGRAFTDGVVSPGDLSVAGGGAVDGRFGIFNLSAGLSAKVTFIKQRAQHLWNTTRKLELVCEF